MQHYGFDHEKARKETARIFYVGSDQSFSGKNQVNQECTQSLCS